jgi:oligoendopeptidase F
MHSYLTWQYQPPIYEDYADFPSETASNFNQALLRAYLLRTDDDPDLQLEVLDDAMAYFYRYLFLMPTLARFEIECHARIERGEGLSAGAMSEMLLGFFREGFGPEVELDGPRVGITWAEFSHLFLNFYTYQYALGISAAHALADDVLRQGAPSAERYLRFLKAGDSVYPLDALRLAGIDLSSPEPVERSFAVMEGIVTRLDQLVGAGPL